jgi:predicted AlkP superfamily pyrophosphatase or phosphodiesterase
MRTRLVALACVFAWGVGCVQEGPAPRRDSEPSRPSAADPHRAPARLVLVSLAALTPDRYQGPDPAMPGLAARAASGVAADAVRAVAPASAYPAHATLVTGRLPARHGIVSDRLGGGDALRSDASLLESPALWKLAADANLRVAALGWPTTIGAELAWNLPDVEPRGRPPTWFAGLAAGAKPEVVALVKAAGGDRPEAQLPGSARDTVLVEVACRLLALRQPPQLLLLHLSQTRPVLAARGAAAPETRTAFRAADDAIARLSACAGSGAAFAVAGDHGALAVHTVVAPNVALAAAGLLTPSDRSPELVEWSAVGRSNGGSAFVYAKASRDAVLARRALDEAAAASGAFRVVSADEMLAAGADPDAWFGLEAEPGFLIADDARGPLLRPATARAGWGYLPGRREMDAGFVAFGTGIARGVRVPEMRQTDVAATLAPLLGLSFDRPDGRVLVGILRLPAPGVAAPR